MVIMNPNEVLIGVDDFKNLVREYLVDRNIGLEQNPIETGRGQWKERMEQRPEVVLAEPMVESRVQIAREEHGHGVEGIKEGLGNLFLVRNGDFLAETTYEDELHG